MTRFEPMYIVGLHLETAGLHVDVAQHAGKAPKATTAK